MATECCGNGEETMILACSGGSNVGQLSNQAAVELTCEGTGRMYCLAGIGGQLSGFVRSAMDVPHLVAIDGCQVGCARAILDKAQVPVKHHIVITELGIEKNKDFRLAAEDIAKVKAAVRDALGGWAAGGRPARDTAGCGCG